MNELQTAVELLIDKHGCAAVFDAIIETMRAKAEHLRSNWQDNIAARDWDGTATKCERALTAAHKAINDSAHVW